MKQNVMEYSSSKAYLVNH